MMLREKWEEWARQCVFLAYNDAGPSTQELVVRDLKYGCQKGFRDAIELLKEYDQEFKENLIYMYSAQLGIVRAVELLESKLKEK